MAAPKHLAEEVDSTRALVNYWRIFRLIGVCPPEGNTLWRRHYRIYSVLWHCLFHVSIGVSFLVNFLLSNSLETFCESICVTMPHIIYILKMVNVVRMRDQLLYSHRLFRRLDGHLSSVQERRIIAKGVDLADFIFLQMARGCVGVMVVGILYVVMSTERTLMFPTWIPWNWQTSSASVFLATVTGYTIGIAETAVMVVTVTTYPGTYLILLSVHTKALAWRVGRLGYDSQQTRDQVQELLIRYIRDHQTIVHLFNLLERSLSMPCFVQFFCTACTQCTICYFLIFARVGIMRFTNMLALLVIFTTESLLLCYTAELVGQEGNNLLAAVYGCNWLDQSVHFRRLLVLMMVRCQKPLILVAGVIVPVRMHTIVVVCKGAYTMLTMLNEMRKTAPEY